MRVAFAYPNPRGPQLIDAVARGEAPDTSLLGQNHLGELGIDAYVVESALRRGGRHSGLAHRLTWNLRELTLPFEARGADVLCTPLANLLPLAARLRRRLRTVLISYHLCTLYERSGGPRRRLLRASIDSADAVVCISEAARARLLEQTGAGPARIHAAPLGVDERYWTAVPPADDGYVLTVGRDLARDYATFAEAVRGLPVRAVLVAKRENVAGLDLPDNVDVRLDIGPGEVRQLYAGAACVVVPIRRESVAVGTENSGTIAMLEAMASARPVVVTERAYLADYVRAGETALTVPAEDPAALRTALESVLADREGAAGLGAAARSAVEERFTSRHFAERLASVFRTLGVADPRPVRSVAVR